MSKNQRLFDLLFERLESRNNKEGYSELVEFFLSLSDEEKRELDVSSMHERLLDDIANFEGDLEIIYAFGNYDDEFKKTAEERVKVCRQTTLISQYLDFNDVDNDEFISLGIRAIRAVLPEKEDEVDALATIKDKAINRGIYDELINGIKTSGDIETVVCASLCFEPILIDEIFDGKANMFLYLSAATFTDRECMEIFRERLLTMDDNSLKMEMRSTAKKIDAKILDKKL